MKKILILISLCLLFAHSGFAQVIAKGSGIVYVNGNPGHAVAVNTDSEFAIDTVSGLSWSYNRDSSIWRKSGFRVERVLISIAPSWTPTDKESEVVINLVDSLYQWRAGAWRHLNPRRSFAATSDATSHTTTLAVGGGSFKIVEGSGIGLATTGTSLDGIVTITATDASITNELQTIANTSNATTHTATLSNSGGSIQLVEGANITLTTTGTGLDGIVTIASTGGGGTDLTFSVSGSPVTLFSSTGADVTFTQGGIVTLTGTATNLTVSATEVDGSISNELQTIANTSNATSHTATLSNSGGSVQLVEGANITLTTTGTGLDGIVTIAAATPAATNLTFSVSGSPVTLFSSTGADVTFTQGGIVTLTGTATNLTVSATEVDGSISNELQTIANTSNATSHTATLSNSGGSIQLVEGANITLTTSGTGLDGILTIASTAAADGNGFYSGNGGNGGDGTIPSVTKSTITNQLTFFRATDDGGGLVPVRIEVPAGNEPDFISFVNGADSLWIKKGDQEFIINANKTMVLSSTELIYLSADSIILQGVSSSFDNEATFLQMSPFGAIVKVEGIDPDVIRQNGATSGQVLKWNGSKWIPDNDAGGAGTDLTFSASGSPVTLFSSTGADVTFTQGGIVTLTGTATNLTVSATEVDGSITNELQTIANTSNATSHTATLSNTGGSIQLVEGANITLTTTGTGLDGIVTIAATSGGGTDLSFSVSGSPVTLFSSSGTDVTLTQGGIVTLTGTASDLTISATEVDGSITNELQTIANTSNATSHTATLSNTGGSIQLVEGANITLTTTGTGLDGIVTIAAATPAGTDLTFSVSGSPVTLFSSTGADVTFTQGGIVTLTGTATNLTVSATEVDGSISNELQTIANTSNATTHTATLSNSGGSLQLAEGSGIGLATTGTGLDGIVTITATDASITNELQTIANTSNATSHTATLSNTGGSLQLVEGANVTLTTTGTGLDGILTIAAASTDLTFGVSGSPVTLFSSTGSDVTFTQGGIVTLTGTATNLTVSATEVDGSISNELQTIANTSNATTHTATLSNTGGSLQLAEGSGIGLATTGTGLDGIVTITATDASITNELQTIANTSNATTHTATLSNSGGSVQFAEGSGIGLATTGTGLDGILTITATDASITNELQTIANTSNATSHTATLSNSGGSIQLVEGANITLTTSGTGLDGIVTIAAATPAATDLSFGVSGSPVTLFSSTGADVTFTQGGIVTLTGTASNLTVSATEVDGSISNELQTIANTSNATTHTATLSNTGGSLQLAEGSGIGLATTGTGLDGIVTITATDASITNELQTIANTSNATSHTATLSNTGGSIQLVEGANITLTTSGTGLDGIVTIASTGGGGSGDILQNGNSFTAAYVIGTNDNNTVSLEQFGTNVLTIGTDKNTTLVNSVATTAATTDQLKININSTGVAADGFGTAILYSGESSTTNDREMGRTRVSWQNATDANREGAFSWMLGDNGGALEEVMRLNRVANQQGTLLVGNVSPVEISASAITTGFGFVIGNSASDLTLGNSTGNVRLERVIAGTTVPAEFYIESRSSGVAGTGFGTSLVLNGESSTTEDRNMATIQTIWVDAVDASRSSDIVFSAVNGTVLAEKFRIRSTGTIQIQAITGTPNMIIGRDGSGNVGQVSVGGGLALASGILTATDQSITNELQTIANTSNATSHTATLSNSGGSIQLVEGANITLTTSGTGLDGIVTIASTGGGGGPADGDYGDITVSGSGSIWTIDNLAVTNAKINDVSVAKLTTGTAVANLAITTTASSRISLKFDGGTTGIEIDDVTPQVKLMSKNSTNGVTVDNTAVYINSGVPFLEYNAGVLRNWDSDATNFVGIKPPATANLTANYTLTLPVDDGTPNQVLQTDGTGILSWATSAGGGVATDAIWDAKGDLAVGTGANTAARLAVGSDGAQVYAEASTATGLRWGPLRLTPAQINADQDNYNPADFAKSQIIRLSGDNGGRAITSFVATFDGDLKTLINVGSNFIYFPFEHPDGTLANRFTGGDRDLILMPGKSVDIYYDGTDGRWRFLGVESIFNEGRSQEYAFSPGSITAADWGNVAFTVNAGTHTSVNGSAAIPGATAIGTSTNATGAAIIGLSKTVTNLANFGSAHLYCETMISIPTLSDASNTFEFNAGLHISSISTATVSNNTCGIRYSHGTNGGKFQGFTRDNGGAETLVDLGTTVAANTIYVLRTEFDKGRTEARFYVNGVFAGRAAGNIPNANACSPRVGIFKTVGNTARTVNIHKLKGGAIWN